MPELANKSAEEFSIERPANSPDEESKIAAGFFVRRRSLLWLSTLTASALLFGCPANLLAHTSADELSPGMREPGKSADQADAVDAGWEDFIKDGGPVVQKLYKDSSPRGQDAYLFALSHWAARLRLNTLPRAKRLGSFGGFNPPVHFGVSYKGVPFFVVEWWLEPGATLPPHNHPNYCVCTLGIEGEAHMRNFEIVGNAPEFSSKDVFHVRETHSEIISPGRINSLSSTRDNIHTFQAGKAGARGIDITTLYGQDKGFSFLNIEDKPGDAEKQIFEATWRKV